MGKGEIGRPMENWASSWNRGNLRFERWLLLVVGKLRHPSFVSCEDTDMGGDDIGDIGDHSTNVDAPPDIDGVEEEQECHSCHTKWLNEKRRR